MSGPRVVAGDGRTIRTFARRDVTPAHQVAAIVPVGERWEVRAEPGANDPYVDLRLESPLELVPDWGSLAAEGGIVALVGAATRPLPDPSIPVDTPLAQTVAAALFAARLRQERDLPELEARNHEIRLAAVLDHHG